MQSFFFQAVGYYKTNNWKKYIFIFSEKPVVQELPERQTFAVGDLVILTCEVSGDPEPSVIWTKDGDTNVSRAQFNSNGRILVITDILPADKGVYECKASNVFGESWTATVIVVAGKLEWRPKPNESPVLLPLLALCSLRFFEFLCNVNSIKAMTMKLGGFIESICFSPPPP